MNGPRPAHQHLCWDCGASIECRCLMAEDRRLQCETCELLRSGQRRADERCGVAARDVADLLPPTADIAYLEFLFSIPAREARLWSHPDLEP